MNSNFSVLNIVEATTINAICSIIIENELDKNNNLKSKTAKTLSHLAKGVIGIASVVSPKASIAVMAPLCLATITLSRLFNKTMTYGMTFKTKPTPYFNSLSIVLSHLDKNKDPISRFKALANIAKTNRLFYTAAQRERATIINSHPEIQTLSFFNSFNEMILFAKSYQVEKLNLSHLNLTTENITLLTQQLPKLIYLDLSSSSIQDTQLQSIASALKNLNHLNIASCSLISPSGIQGLLSLRHLIHLNVGSTKVSDANLQVLASKLENLTEISISNCQSISSDGIQALVSLKKLTNLNMSLTNVSDADLKVIGLKLHKLTGLNLHGCKKLTSTGFESIISLQNLTDLDIGNSSIDGKSFNLLAAHLVKLTKLNIDFCRLSGRDLDAVSSFAKLTDLHISFTDVDNLTLKKIALLTQLTSLRMNSCFPSSEGLTSLSSLKKLIHLELANTYLEDVSFKMIASQLTNLTFLSIKGSFFMTSEGIKNLELLKNLTHLDISESKVDDASMEIITTHLTKLTELGLHHCEHISPKGIKAISSLINLVVLDLRNTDVDDATLKEIAPHLIHLKALSIGSCTRIVYGNSTSWSNITDNGLFLALKSLKKLQRLNIFDCPQINAGHLQIGFNQIEINAFTRSSRS